MVLGLRFNFTDSLEQVRASSTHSYPQTHTRDVIPRGLSFLVFASLPWLPESGGISHRLQGPSFSLLSGTGNWRTARFAEFEYRKSNSPQVMRSLRVYSPQMGGLIHNMRGTDSLVIKHFVARQLELLLCNICTTQIFACPPAEGSSKREYHHRLEEVTIPYR